MSAKSQSHTSRSKVWALNYVSALYLLYLLKYETWVKCSAHKDDVQNLFHPHTFYGVKSYRRNKIGRTDRPTEEGTGRQMDMMADGWT